MREMLLRAHLGLGDLLVCNAIGRHFAQNHSVTILTKPHNAASLAFMWRDELNINLIEVEDDNEADAIVHHIRGQNRKVLCLGNYGEKPFNPQFWDKEFYRQAGIPFVQRWNGFRVNRQPSRELKGLPNEPFAFVHDDPARGFVIDKKRLPKMRMIHPDPQRTTNIFDYWDFIEKATQIHVIDSSFAILIDSLPDLQAKVMQVHLYARPNALPPSYTKEMWQVLK